jgi:hypothetical protein
MFQSRGRATKRFKVSFFHAGGAVCRRKHKSGGSSRAPWKFFVLHQCVSHRAALTPLAGARDCKNFKGSPAKQKQTGSFYFCFCSNPLRPFPFCRCTIQHLLHPEAAECEVDHCDGERRHAVLGAGFPLVSTFHCLASRESLGTILRPKLVELFSRAQDADANSFCLVERHQMDFCLNFVLSTSIFGPAWPNKF